MVQVIEGRRKDESKQEKRNGRMGMGRFNIHPVYLKRSIACKSLFRYCTVLYCTVPYCSFYIILFHLIDILGLNVHFPVGIWIQ